MNWYVEPAKLKDIRIYVSGLTLDVEKKLLYWVEAKHHYIAVVDWNGGNRQIILKEREALPQPFSVSLYHSELYWTDWTTK